MGLFNRKRQNSDNNSGDGDDKKDKAAWRRPANTAFKQQRLKAWQPILTPKTVLPTLFIIGIIFAPIGALLVWGSGKVTEITIEYTKCDEQTPVSSTSDSGAFHDVSYSRYRMKSGESDAKHNTPQYAYIQSSNQCVVRFDIPYDLDASVFMYYKLTNFYQNHRRYVKSLNTDQLKGEAKSADDLHDGDCKPLAVRDGKPIYPCGLIANSIFNDTISLSLKAVSAGTDYSFTDKGIAWSGEKKKYKNRPKYQNYAEDIVPPPNWMERYPNGYNDSNIPQLEDDEHFQNWMRTAGLPTFTKLYGRNDNDKLTKGTYEVTIDLRYPVKSYKGTKSIVISTVSWIGGKNPFLGWAYVGAAALFVLLGVIGTIRHLVRPRRLGDMSLLSWNRT